MASADVTLFPTGAEFEVDGTQHAATLTQAGGWLRNTSSVDAVVSPDNKTITVAQPLAAGLIRVPAGKAIQLPPECRAFTFKAASKTFLQYSAYPMMS